MTPLYESVLYSLFLFLPAAISALFLSALMNLGRLRAKEELRNLNYSPYVSFFNSAGKRYLWGSTVFSLQTTKFFYYLVFGFAAFFLFFVKPESEGKDPFEVLLFIEILSLVFLYVTVDLLAFLITRNRPEKIMRFFSLVMSVLMIPCAPFLFIYFKIKNALRASAQETKKLPFRLQDKIVEYLSDSDIGRYLDKSETKLIHTVISFKDRIVREVMVPRIDVFSLPLETTIKEAAHFFSIEGYSRIPVYKDNVDKIVGVLLYKDVLSVYTKHIENNKPEEDLHKTVEQLIKPALYTPETKKIAGLLQEFRNKQIHLAIVVDEYGGTEGIVTIEDILEELVGEIEDEYDTQETKIYFPLSSGGWIVDAKIGILTLEEELGVKIPQSPEYDTVGGFVFHKTGSIPGQGWKVHLDDVDLEILTSDERSIQKIKITPVSHKHKKHS